MLARQREAGPTRIPETATRILMVFSPDEGRITLREGEWPVPDDGIAWEVSVSFPAKFTSGEAEMIVAANAVYVEQAVRVLRLEPENEVEFSTAGELKAFMVRPVGDQSVFVVTMPMQRYWPTPAGMGGELWQRFTDGMRRVVVFAQEEAGKRCGTLVSTEHLLLGLVRENDSAAARTLGRMGVDLDSVRSEVERHMTRSDGRSDQHMQLAPDAERVVELARDEAAQLNSNCIGTEHLLLGLIREAESPAARVLAEFGVDLATMNQVEA
jgi:hypothetical protein